VQLNRYVIEAHDGAIGEVKDLLFDDKTWKIRWLVVDVGTWLAGRKVLLHPSCVIQGNYMGQKLAVRLTRAQIKDSPTARADEPVSRRMEHRVFDYYGWDTSWGGSIFGSGALNQAFDPPPIGNAHKAHATPEDEFTTDEGDPDLRSTTVVTGYHAHASDGEIGHVENFLIDDTSWTIHYLIVDTRDWLPGRHVLISPFVAKAISWPDRHVRLDVTRLQVKGSPPWDPAEVVSNVYEKRLHGYYGWPGYGW
jgi:hypothetical protein